MARIICLGIAVIDRVFEVEAIPATPIKVQAKSYRERAGGVAATAAVAVAALGHEAVYWGRLGDDSTGDRVYMLDITRNNVAVLSRVHPDPKEPLANPTSSSGNFLLKLIGLE